MKRFSFSMSGRTLLMLTAVLAFGLTGCGGDDNPSNGGGGGGGGDGGSIVGDWLYYSTTNLDDGKTEYEHENHKSVTTFKSSGEVVIVHFSRPIDIWEEWDPLVGRWSVNGSTLTIGSQSAQYQLSGDRLTITGYNDSGRRIKEVNIRVNLADLRRSLGL